MAETFKCPGRDKPGVIADFWTTSGQCTYCGSIEFNKFLMRIDVGEPVTMSKETRSFYFDDGSKFCFHHASPEEQAILQQMYEDKKFLIKNKK